MPTRKDLSKPLFWVASSKKDLREMPCEVQDAFGYALHMAQTGERSSQSKPLKGFGSAGVLEVIESSHGDTYRAVYTIKFANAVYVLHCFQKKSTKGIETAKPDADKIHDRLKAAEAHATGARS
jgi:phage-related protein